MAQSAFTDSPVSAVTLSGDVDVSLKGLIVVVGPNSSGKTNLLRDIHAAATGVFRRLVVCRRLTYRRPPSCDEFIEHFVQTGDLELMPDGRYRKTGHHYGAQGGGGEYDMPSARLWHSAFVSRRQPDGQLDADAFLQHFGGLECSALFLENRLLLAQTTPSFDPAKQAPQTLIQALWLDRAAQRRLETETGRVFGRGVWLENTRSTHYMLRVSDGPGVPSPDEQRDYKLVQRYESIEVAGDGLRSYVAVCITLMLARRPLSLIDEPEMCLHPPQARALGQLIGSSAGGVPGCIVIATHSSHVLRGILETSGEVVVIRLMRDAGGFRARVVAPDVLAEATTKAQSKSENTLDGLFASGVVVCEGEGDRVVYESTGQTLEPGISDVRFVPVNGIGGFRQAMRLYRDLGVPVAAIADLDSIAADEVADIVADASPTGAASLRKRLRKCREQLRHCAGRMSPDDVIRTLKETAAQNWDWAAGDDRRLRERLSGLVAQLNPLGWLKVAGASGIDQPLRSEVEGLIEELRSIGVFVVPVGELEGWAPDVVGSDVGRSNKAAWATVAAERIRQKGKCDGDIWQFVEDVATYLRGGKPRGRPAA